jgi:FlaA1/EpsC-like NDP-sugar epimerase
MYILEFSFNLFNLMIFIDINKLTRLQKQSIIVCVDVLCVMFSVWVSFSLRFDELYVFELRQLILLPIAIVVGLPIFIRFNLYRTVIRYAGIKALWSIFQAVTIFVLLWGIIAVNLDFQIPYTIPLIAWLVVLVLIGGSRIVARSLFSTMESKTVSRIRQKHVYIYGAGKAGTQLASALDNDATIDVVGFIDDDVTLHNKHILGLKVNSFEAVRKQLTDCSSNYLNIDEILLAVPSASNSNRLAIISKLKSYPVNVRTLPGFSDLALGKVNIDVVKEININDLLGREVVKPNKALLNKNIKDKAVLVTGAGGSIGSELCRKIILLEPKRLILFELSELALYQIEKELLGLLENGYGKIEIIPVLGSVVDQRHVERICNVFKVQTIYHAAAYKHVPMVEKNISVGVQNNIFGTLYCAQAAINCNVETFVLISTDKAVRPTNTMGATKRFAELILQGLSSSDRSYNTRFTMVRFGNVLGSSGSVIPLFKEQIRKGQNITVTDPNIVRYFMTIPEAAQLVIQAGAMGKGGDVFVLDMGEPIKILDLAKRMIHLSGYEIKSKDNPKGDIEIIFTGLRPGEKLYEELLIGNRVSETNHPLIMRAEEEVVVWEALDGFMKKISDAIVLGDSADIRNILQTAVIGFEPQCDLVDVLSS